MRTFRSALTLLLATSLAAPPLLVYARAGGSYTAAKSATSGAPAAAVRAAPKGGLTYQSQGSRGMRTESEVSGAQGLVRTQRATVAPVQNNNAGLGASVTRTAPPASSATHPQRATVAPSAAYAAPVASSRYVEPAPTPAPTTSFVQRHPVATGVLSGMAGAYLYDRLSGNHQPAASNPVVGAGAPAPQAGGLPYAAQQGSAPAIDSAATAPVHAVGQENRSSFGGLLLTLGLFVALIAIGVVAYRRMAGGPYPASTGAPRVEPAQEADYAVSADDKKVFAALVGRIQSAWSDGDLHALALHASPEMVQYYKEALDGNASQRVRNIVEDVRDVLVSVVEAWQEGPVSYATCRMDWTALDYTCDLTRQPTDAHFIVDGDREHSSNAREVWTFGRHVDGDWILTAVQQTA